jgi:nucleoside-diphosphate-sugar epimerase
LKTLVTGATGFIGKHLVKALVEQGRYVRCLVRKSSDTDYLQELGVELCYGDLLNKDSLKNAVKDVSIIYHLAGEVFSTRPRDYYKINVDGTQNLLKLCSSENIEKFIYLSSIAAVGPNRKTGELLNETTPYKPITPYGISKYKTEEIVSDFSERYGLPVIIIRAPTVYGPGVNTASRVFLFLDRIDKGLYRIIGDGTNLISLCYIDNLINGILLAEEKQVSGYSTYFIADHKPYAIKEMAQKIAENLNTTISKFCIPVWIAKITGFIYPFLKLKKSKTPISKYMIKEIAHSWACDISKAKQELGYNPMIDFNQGIRKTVMWYKEKYGVTSRL